MKKIILLLILFSTLLLAQGTPLVLSTYATNKEINITEIAQYASKFEVKTEDEDEGFQILWDSDEPSTIRQDTQHQFNWIMVKLDNNLSRGNYWIEHTAFDFDKHSFNPSQYVEKFSFLGRKYLSFYYDKTQDSQRYFLQATPSASHVIPLASLYTPQTFSAWIDGYGLKMLISFFLFGLIFMTAIYNGALYLYNREQSFLYYMLMQLFMIVVLVYQTDMVQTYVMGHIEDEEIAIFFYFIIVETVIIFILLFVRSFLETKKYLPFQDKILHYIMLFAIFDLILFFLPIMLIFQLYSFFLLYVVWVAWLRLQQGYQPALFFIFGWFSLMVGVFLSDFFPDELLSFDPILMGSTIEAFFLAIAISYKMREIRDEKEEQKELLVHQSRLASMGDMLGNIAHQWRQPLSRLGYILMNIELKDKDQLHEKKLEEATTQLEFMSQTIDDFRNFYAPNKSKELFSLVEATQNVMALLNFKEVEIELKVGEEMELLNYKNEYKQVVLNLLTNARDILVKRKIASPKILIKIDGFEVKISDNGGGVEVEKIQQIFEPYFTTKERGLGIGLYMSKMIVEKNMGGMIEVSNEGDGAVFRLRF